MLVLNVIVLSLYLTQISFANIRSHPNWQLLDHENCGESQSDRIIGGTTTELGQYPWMVRLGYVKRKFFSTTKPVFKCGGSLINPTFVVTAAHCIIHTEELAVVRLGEYDTKTRIDCDEETCAPPVQDFTPISITVHEGYSKPDMWHDVTLIQLDRPANLNSFVNPICLPYTQISTSVGEIAGWGITDMAMKRQSRVPQMVQVPILPQKRCGDVFAMQMGPGQICAGGHVGKDSCGGDSGGPLMVPAAVDNAPPRYFLIGVVSYGSASCGGSAPAIYTDVAYHMQWILDHLKP